MPTFRRFFGTAIWTLLLPLALAGCGGGGPPDDSAGDETENAETVAGDSSAFVGTWALRQGTGNVEWYVLFKADNSWLISDTSDGSAQRVYGTYVVEDNQAAGPMINPGTGEGEIVATLDGEALALDFVEYWHDPYKHVLYNGTRI